MISRAHQGAPHNANLQNSSLVQNLCMQLHDFSHFMNSITQVDIGILDFSKAFDKVDHPSLLQKLEFYGVRGKPLYNGFNYFYQTDHNKSWLKDHILPRVALHQESPMQGSVLGPTLFLTYINDLVNEIKSTVRLFADDCLIYQPILTPADHQILREGLQKLFA